MMYHVTKVSTNKKTGPIPVTTSTRENCPDACPFKGAGCYADSGPLALHWREVTEGRRGGSWGDLLQAVRSFKRGQLWRHNQAGDLPGDRVRLDAEKLAELTAANRGRMGYTYTHYSPHIYANLAAIRAANAGGFVVNISANGLHEVDEICDLGGAPVVTVLPAEADRSKNPDAPKTYTTEKGRRVVLCPATYRDTSCADCGLCAVPTERRPYVIGFPAHGTSKRKASEVARGRALPVVNAA